MKSIDVDCTTESHCIARDDVKIERKMMMNCFDPGKEDVPWSGLWIKEWWAQDRFRA